MTRLALTHEWLEARSGSEKTFEAMASALPEAELHALTVEPSAAFDFGGRDVATTFIDRLGPLRRRRALTLPVMPLAWSVAGSGRRYDVVVTSSHACAKGFRPAREALHLCYCYTPLRYVWAPTVDQRSWWSGAAASPAKAALRRWDRRSARWVDEFAAISTEVQARIKDSYGRDSSVIHPPVDTDFYVPGEADRGLDVDVLVVSRFVSYKRIDTAIEACRIAGRSLTVAGWGPDEARLRRIAGDAVTFEVNPDDNRLRELYRRARVLLFPGLEDFGIVPVEAQACGTPVIAHRGGGVLDTVPEEAGILVDGDDVRLFAAALEEGRSRSWDRRAIRRSAERFSRDRFVVEFRNWVASAVARAEHQ